MSCAVSPREAPSSALSDASVRQPCCGSFIEKVNIACFKCERLTTGVHYGLRKRFKDSNTNISFFRRWFHRSCLGYTR